MSRSVCFDANLKTPLSLAGRFTMTTFERSRTEVTVVMPRAFPAVRKKIIASPATG